MSYFRVPSRGNRFYANFKANGGPSLKALVPDGEKRATKDPHVARDLYNRWTKFYMDDQRRRHLGLTRHITLADAAEKYLIDRTERRDGVKVGTLEKYALDLENRLIPYFGADTPLGSIREPHVAEYCAHRRRQSSKKGGTISDGSIRRELSVLSSLFEWAIKREWVLENPVQRHGFPAKAKANPHFLEPNEAWALLEAAAEDCYPYAQGFLGVMLYCGLRQTEARGLEARDVDREAGVIHVRDNRFRSVANGGLKNVNSVRDVPLWPDLLDMLPARIGAVPLFPSPHNDDQPLSINPQRMFQRIVERAGIMGKNVTPHLLRHTWCATRLQTLDNGAPVAPFTVMREGGWSSLAMIEKVYGHLPDNRLRLSMLTYRPRRARSTMAQ